MVPRDRRATLTRESQHDRHPVFAGARRRRGRRAQPAETSPEVLHPTSISPKPVRPAASPPPVAPCRHEWASLLHSTSILALTAGSAWSARRPPKPALALHWACISPLASRPGAGIEQRRAA
jgi:hypothetical protein